MILFNLIAVILSSIAGSGNIDQIDRSTMADQVIFFMSHSRNESLKSLFTELISLAGVILMWKMKKTGFIFYVIGESFAYFYFIYLVASLNLDFRSATAAGIEMLWPLPFDLAFIIMYATQLKFMSWKFRAAAGI